MDPRLYLAIDNCYASKRWVRPSEWLRQIKALGLKYVEASADTECDPLYMGERFTRDWIEDVKANCAALSMAVKNVYSGHGTYATCGLSHYDAHVTRRFRDQWMKPQMDTANALGAGFGFFAHGFEDLLLQDNNAYVQKLDELCDTLSNLAAYAQEIGMAYAGIEQMYSPHQPPWTVDGTKKLLSEVWKRSKAPFYITADLGHMNGQQYFKRPDEDYIRRVIHAVRSGKPERRVWLGTERARSLYLAAATGKLDEDAALAEILADVRENPNLFAQPQDWSIDNWLRTLGCYAPIVHLQQSDGKSSPHWPFSPEFNAKGVVKGEAVMAALIEAFKTPDDPSMPPKCDEVVLTLEPFISTAGNNYDLIDDLKQSVVYWRRWIPQDGIRLSEIEKLL